MIPTTLYPYYRIHRPNLSEECVLCHHTFGEHYEQFDGDVVGCNHKEEALKRDKSGRFVKRDTATGQFFPTDCSCDGFAMRYKKSYEWTFGYGNSSDYSIKYANATNNATINDTTVTTGYYPDYLNRTATAAADVSETLKEGDIVKIRQYFE